MSKPQNAHEQVRYIWETAWMLRVQAGEALRPEYSSIVKLGVQKSPCLGLQGGPPASPPPPAGTRASAASHSG